MKKIILAAILFLSAAAARAQNVVLLPPREPSLAVTQAVSDTDTVRGIDISSQTPTDIIIDTTSGYRSVSVYNLDTSSVNCAEFAYVSTITANNSVGHPVPTGIVYGNPYTFLVRPGTRFYCLGQSVTRAMRAVITRLR